MKRASGQAPGPRQQAPLSHGGTTRRQLLHTAGLALLAACASRGRAPGQLAPPQGAALRLGWRWPPGMQATWQTVVRRTVGAVAVERVAVWSYVASQVDEGGLVYLDAGLDAIGAGVDIGGAPAEADGLDAAREALRRDEATASLVLRPDGGVADLSTQGFGAGLPHRLLGVALPSRGVRPGDAWPDDALVVPFLPLLPDVDGVEASGTTALEAEPVLAADADPALPTAAGLVVGLAHAATLRTPGGGPYLRLTGHTWWALNPGRPVLRELTAELVPDRPMRGAAAAGRLDVRLEWLPDGAPAS